MGPGARGTRSYGTASDSLLATVQITSITIDWPHDILDQLTQVPQPHRFPWLLYRVLRALRKFVKNADDGVLVASPVANRSFDTIGFMAMSVAYYLKPNMTYDEWVDHMVAAQSKPLEYGLGRLRRLPFHPETGFKVTPFMVEWTGGSTWLHEIEWPDVSFKQRDIMPFNIKMSETHISMSYLWTKVLFDVLWEEIIHPTSKSISSLLERYQTVNSKAKTSKVRRIVLLISRCTYS